MLEAYNNQYKLLILQFMVGHATLILLVFVFFLIINVMSSGGHFDVTDGIDYFLATEGMVFKHSAKVYPDSPSLTAGNLGNYDIDQSIRVYWYLAHGTPYPFPKLVPIYEAHCCLLSAIAVPFYYASIIFSVPPIAVIGILVNSLILTLISVVIFCFSLEFYKSRRIAFILSLIFGVCSFAWPYNNTLSPQPLATLLIISSAYFIYLSSRRGSIENGKAKQICCAGLGGLFLALSIYAHPPSIIVIPGFVLYSIHMMKHYKQNLSVFLIIFSIFILLAGVINYWRFGSFTNLGYGTEYQSLSTNHGWQGLVGLLVSPGFGLVFFFPIVIMLPIALKYTYKQNKHFFFLTIYVTIIYLLYFGTLAVAGDAGWSGEHWGPRYLLPTLPFITIALGTLLQHSKGRLFLKISFVILCVVGFNVNLLGKLVYTQFAKRYGWAVERLNLYDKASLKSSPQELPTKIYSEDFFTWIPAHSNIALSMKALMSNYVTNKTVNPNDGSWRTDTLINCPYDLYIYCKIGIGPMLLLSAVIAVLATVIIMDRPRSLFLYFKNVNAAKR